MILAATDNPLMAGLEPTAGPEPCVIVIFGATGDLTRRKLIGAIYNLAVENLLPESFAVMGFARREKAGIDEDRSQSVQVLLGVPAEDSII